jgi:fatty acid desaturase
MPSAERRDPKDREQGAGSGEPGNWSRSTRDLRSDLASEIPVEILKGLHRLRPFRHFAVAARQIFLLALLAWASFRLANPWLWVPLALLQGFVLFDFTVLLHEVVHRLVWRRSKDRKAAYKVLGWIYALPSGISPAQFTKWHLDHHSGLGTLKEDPKRNRLSPKRNARWLKALYFTPALFFIYFRAAGAETRTYGADLRVRILKERLASVGFHAAMAVAVGWSLGLGTLARVYLVPYLFGFPLAFGLNRLGQHYDIDPERPERWGTRLRRSLPWDLAFLNSGYHLEHHYFPGVPLYNLRRLNRLLEPFFEAHGIPARSYGWLLWQYLGKNRAPHTNWANECLLGKSGWAS